MNQADGHHRKQRRVSKLSGLLFLSASVILNGLNFTFHLVFSRSLGPGSYGSLGALLAITLVCAVPMSAIQLAHARAQAQSLEMLSARSAVRNGARAGLVVGILCCAASPVFSSFLHLNDVAPVLWLAVWLAAATACASLEGLLMGRGRVKEVAAAVLVGTGLVRFTVGLLVAFAGLGVTGAMLATAAGQIVTYLIFVRLLGDQLAHGLPEAHMSGRENFVSLASLTGFAAFGSVDTLVARHGLPAMNSGYYVAAATVGRVALFAPGAIALLTFSRFAVLEAGSRAERLLLGRCLLAVLLLGASVAVILAVFPSVALNALFGNQYGPAKQLLVPLAISGCLLGCLNLTLFLHIAHRSRSALLGWAGALAIVLVGLSYSLTALSLAYCVVSAAVVVASTSVLAAFRRPPASARSDRQLVADA